MNGLRGADRVSGIVVAGAACLIAVASCGGDGDGGGQAAAAESKLESCKLISEGQLNLGNPETDEDRCFADCFLKASCDDLEIVYCGGEDSFENLSEATRSCFAGCIETVECQGEDGMTMAYVCDGDPECMDGSDEKDCPESELFSCDDGEEKIPIDFKCDGETDCTDGSDEVGCPAVPTFRCKDGQEVPADSECDLEPDCEDSSDEHDGCAQVMCGGG
jgi:hypothetical protein